MESRICGRSYLLLPDGEKEPVKIRKTYMDRTISCLKAKMDEILEMLKDMEYSDSDCLKVLQKYVFEPAFGDNTLSGDSRVWRMEYASCRAGDLLEELKNSKPGVFQDLDRRTLEDLGFRSFGKSDFWENTIINDDEKEVVEEVFVYEKKLIFRVRTTWWTIIDPGAKHSKKIEYKSKKTTASFRQCVRNTGLDFEKYY